MHRYSYRSITTLCLLMATVLTFPSFAELPVKKDPNFKPEEHLLKQAKKDDKKAQLELALCYLVGKYAVELDADEALEWLTKAASLDRRSIRKKLPPNPRALLYMGFCHENPMYADFLEIKIDHKKALDYYLQAESKGYQDAAQYIAKTYRHLGQKKESIAYFKKAAELKIPAAQVEYGKLLMSGDGLKQDAKAAIPHLEEAGKKGNGEAFLLLADIYSGSFDSVPQNFEKMIDCLWQAASTRSDAMTRLAYCYLHGLGLPKDEILAFKWYKKAATAADPDANAQIALARCYSKGLGTDVDPAKAFEYYLIASADESAPPIAHYNVALCYLEGKGVPADNNQAFLYLKKAADADFPSAWVLLGTLYEEGKAFNADDITLAPVPDKAFSLYKKAADKNHMGGLVETARCYYKGIGTTENKEEAIKILRAAAKLGSNRAVQLLMEFNEPVTPQATPDSGKVNETPSESPVAQKPETPDSKKPLLKF